ncbi:YHS domain-containing protein [Spirillospora sp. CA-255316]
MLFIELFVPRDALDADRCRQVAQSLLGRMTGDGEEAMAGPAADVFASQFQVVVHRPETWVVGDRLAGDPSPYMVRVHAPGPWRKDTSEHIIGAFTKAITDLDPGAAVQVHVLGVPEGSIGVRGEAKTSTELVEMMNDPLRQAHAEGRALLDPMCGMLVEPDKAPTLEYEGTLYGFCCEGCRTEFIAKKEKEAARAGTG